MQESFVAEAERRAEEALLDLLLPNMGKKPGKKKTPPAPVVKPMGSFTFNPENGGGAGLIGTAIQVGIPAFMKDDADNEEEGQENRT
jgi:ATP-dependent HslUV protease ATP-binding subunit HslU